MSGFGQTSSTDSYEHDELLAALLQQLLNETAGRQLPDIGHLCEKHPEIMRELRELWSTAVLVEDLVCSAQDCSSTQSAGSGIPQLVGTETTPSAVSHRLQGKGDYELLSELGRGGMGVVYQARQRSLSRIVALKMILKGALASPADFARFRGEAESVARMTHPHIVPIYEVGDWDGQPYFTMQFVEGSTLAQRLAEGPLPPRESARLLIPICRAIGHAHEQGILHRDLKPSNVLIDSSGHPFVTDFGLAKRFPVSPKPEDEASLSGTDSSSVRNEAATALTQSGSIVGTPGYMAPEQAVGTRGNISVTTDVYSLGAILYAMLTGRAPFQAASPVDTLLMVLEQDPPPPRYLNSAADRDLEMIALKALQKPTDLRYSSADAMARDLEAFLAGDPISARASHFSQILSRAFRPTHHVGVLQHWGLLWMWHALVLIVLCLTTNILQWRGVESRNVFVLLWTIGLGTWAYIFWTLRRRAGPVTFVERQIAHVWAASMACSTFLFAIEWILELPPLRLSPVLALIAGAVFVVKAGILTGEFYVSASILFVSCIPMALFPEWGLAIFGVVSGLAFAIPGWKFYRQNSRSLS